MTAQSGKTIKTLPYLSMNEVCAILGYKQTPSCRRWARQVIRARAKKTNLPEHYGLLSGLAHQNKTTRITLQTLKVLFKEKFDRKDELSLELQRYVEDMREEMLALRREIERVRIAARKRDDLIAQEIKKLKALLSGSRAA